MAVWFVEVVLCWFLMQYDGIAALSNWLGDILNCILMRGFTPNALNCFPEWYWLHGYCENLVWSLKSLWAEKTNMPPVCLLSYNSLKTSFIQRFWYDVHLHFLNPLTFFLLQRAAKKLTHFQELHFLLDLKASWSPQTTIS